MDIKIFDNRILAPAKCGSRYLSKVFSVKKVTETPLLLSQKVTHIIVRNPLEHFKSAIHTEYFNSSVTPLNDLVYHSTTKRGIGHWNPYTYKFLYEVFLLNPSIEIIDLPNLSHFLESENKSVEYTPSEFDWSQNPNWIHKDELYKNISQLYPHHIKIIENLLENEIIHYLNLIGKKTIKTII